MKSITIAIVLAFLTSGCATLVTKQSPAPKALLTCPSKSKSVLVRSYSKFRWKELGSRDLHLSSNPKLGSEIFSLLEKTGCFSKIKLAKLPAENMTFRSDSPIEPMFIVPSEITSQAETAEEKIDKFLDLVASGSSHDIVMDIYESGDRSVHGNMYLMMPWSLLHFASLGLIPIYFENEIEYEIRLSSKGKSRTKQNFQGSLSAWSWSPLVFNKRSGFGSKVLERAKLEETTLQNGISEMLSAPPAVVK